MPQLRHLLIRQPSHREVDVAVLLARFVLAWIFAYHGSQKLFGWFDGGGITGTGSYFTSVGVSPGELMAWVAGLTEFVGAVLLAVGLLTRIAAAALAVEMLAVIVKINWANGLIAEKAAGGYEINLALAALGCSLLALGAGRFSIDRALAENDGRDSP